MPKGNKIMIWITKRIFKTEKYISGDINGYWKIVYYNIYFLYGFFPLFVLKTMEKK